MARWRIGLFLLILWGCSKNPTEPEPQKTVTIFGPKQVLIDSAYQYVAKANFSSDAMLYARWHVDDSVFQTPPTIGPYVIPWTFHTVGQHIIQVDLFRTGDNALVCSAIDTIQAAQIFLSLSPDSISVLPFQTVVFRATIKARATLKKYYLRWTNDTLKSDRTNVDTFSTVFVGEGWHAISVECLDSNKAVLGSAQASVNVVSTTLTVSSNVTDGFPLTPIIFTATLTHKPTTYTILWDFGDTQIKRKNSDTITHSFSTTGFHTITATLLDTLDRKLSTVSIQVNIRSVPFLISASTSSTTALTPITCIAQYNFSQPTSIVWDFGDGVRQTVNNATISHAFVLTGSLIIRAVLYSGSTMLASDSVQISISPSLIGFDILALAHFKKVQARLIDSRGGAWCVPFEYDSDSLIWNSTDFSFSNGSSGDTKTDDPSNQSTYYHSWNIGSSLHGKISLDGLNVDTLSGHNIDYESQHIEGAHSSTYGHQFTSDVNAKAIGLVWFSPDSACYVIMGSIGKDNVKVSGYCHTYGSGQGDAEGSYSGPDWNSANPVPRVEVTFYKK